MKMQGYEQLLEGEREIPPKFARWLVGQFELYGDLRLDLDGLAVEQVRLILPLLHGVGGGLGELRVTAESFDLRDGASLGDGGCQFDGAFHAHTERSGRIDRRNFLDQQSLRNSLRNVK